MRYSPFHAHLQESLDSTDGEWLITEGYVKFSFTEIFLEVLSHHDDSDFFRPSLADLGGKLSHFFSEVKIEA